MLHSRLTCRVFNISLLFFLFVLLGNCTSETEGNTSDCCKNSIGSVSIEKKYSIGDLLLLYQESIDSTFKFGLSEEFLLKVDNDTNSCVKVVLSIPPPLKSRELGWDQATSANCEKVKIHDSAYFFKGRKHSIDSVDVILNALEWTTSSDSKIKRMCIETYGQEEYYNEFINNILSRYKERSKDMEKKLGKTIPSSCFDKLKVVFVQIDTTSLIMYP